MRGPHDDRARTTRTTRAARPARALARGLGAAALATASVVVLAGPASAEVPQGWPENPPVDLFHAVLLIGGVALAVIVVVTAITVGPALARGESIAPGVAPVEDQWLGGRRRGPELEAPQPGAGRALTGGTSGETHEDSDSGGAGARW